MQARGARHRMHALQARCRGDQTRTANIQRVFEMLVGAFPVYLYPRSAAKIAGTFREHSFGIGDSKFSVFDELLFGCLGLTFEGPLVFRCLDQVYRSSVKLASPGIGDISGEKSVSLWSSEPGRHRAIYPTMPREFSGALPLVGACTG